MGFSPERKEAAVMTATILPMLPQPYLVRQVQRETPNTFTLVLEAKDHQIETPFGAGQFNMLYKFGVGEVPVSMSSDPARPEKLEHTIRVAGAITRALCEVKKGDMIGVRGPFGTAWPISQIPTGSDVLIIAGGIGMAPLRSAIYQLLAERKKYGNLLLLYGTRAPQDFLFQRELQKWQKRPDFGVRLTVDRPLSAQEWRSQISVGVVPSLIPKATFHPGRTVALICGPEIMMRYSVMELQKRGVGLENIYVSMERNLKCAVGWCGHCQWGPTFICRDGPVFSFDQISRWFEKREV
jgi:NAD(P)H-flavin reductase